ncbi:outer membrane protein assembly factor BamD [Mucilaginibacter daejeonensis]|uniref:outer membrane protein assembly factor BamD n=1 Tax=Mucilaginibacter daejeonensis TaxID=398049 RepID=UPI001D1776CF|nr:outer membrane protein assembly factor BamD [Mucilaginibacter daejeonensis]UEG53132.1 outer membrane protein assembly factor BamD [Mucilaginibacter daejeonensis]
MFKKQRAIIASLLVTTVLIIGSCKSNYEKLKEGNDRAKQYQQAIKYYNKKEYSKALELFELLTPKYRGHGEAEELFYYYAYANYYLKDYTSARYHFKNFADMYPSSNRAEECRYMSAFCYYKDSPNYSLDQDNTTKAIETLQLFINLYPKSERSAEAAKLIQNLRDKLETKAYANAKLYLDIGDYLSAVIAFNNALRDYPDTKYGEEMEYLMIKAQYMYARNSSEARQEERFNQAIAYADQFTEKYATSKYKDDATDYRRYSERGIAASKRTLAAWEAEGKLHKKLSKDSTRRSGQQQSVDDRTNQKSPQN